MHQYNVDLFINGHVHKYERTYPVYTNDKAYYETETGKEKSYFKNPRATVFVTEGLPGNDKSHDNDYELEAFSIVTSNRTGYGILDIKDGKELTYSRKATDTGEIMDSFTIKKDQLRTFKMEVPTTPTKPSSWFAKNWTYLFIGAVAAAVLVVVIAVCVVKS